MTWFLAVLSILATALTVRAGAGLEGSAAVALEGRTGEPLSGSVVIVKDPKSVITFSRNELRDDVQCHVIPRPSITVTSETPVKGDTRQTFTITVSGIVEAGTYTGTIDFFADGKALPPVPVVVAVRLSPVLKTVTVPTPEIVRCSGGIDCRLAALLVNRSNLDRESKVLLAALSNDKAAAVYLNPVFVTATGAAHNNVVGSDVFRLGRITSRDPRVMVEASIDRDRLLPDQYSGVIYGKVTDAADLVMMPFSISVRSGPLTALRWLLAGLILGFAVQWMNAKGEPQAALLIRVDRLRHRLSAQDAAILGTALDNVRELAYAFELARAQTEMNAIEERVPKLVLLTQIEQTLLDRPDRERVKPILVLIDKARGLYGYRQDPAAEGVLSAIFTEVENLPEDKTDGVLRTHVESLERSVTVPHGWAGVRRSAPVRKLREWIGQARADFIRFIARPLLWLGLVAALLFIGMELFWVKNTSFGAQPLADNISLILWGLSANVASARLSSLPALVR